uniref:Calpain catalytic domain-containing protein n=1 Tax=Magnetococcus massalia (strain MO-1) TaxID=451514 RepID=A0A1S7LJK3_MAGMO|nr:Putative protein involve in cell communication. Containing ten Calx-beta domains [Candidatus Magnetococcus massalia]
MSWNTTLSNSSLQTLVTTAISDSSISYDEMLTILSSAASGGITATEHADLKTIHTNSSDSLYASDYLETISYNVIYDNTANAYWWGGTQTYPATTLGNMASGMSEQSAEYLVDKWFLGLDNPMPIAGGDTATGEAATGVYSYGTVTGELFVNGAAASDINQGMAGTCYLVATFGSVANADSSLITGNFIDNGNDTYGVKFYLDGEAVYTTVNETLPVTSWNSVAFTSNSSASLSGESWVGLYEKAFVQLNAQADINNGGSLWSGEASYQAVEGGFASPIKQITNLDYSYYSSYYSGVPDAHKTAEYHAYSSSTYKQTLIDALDNNAIVWLGSFGNSYDGTKKNFVSGHAYMVLDYSSSTDTFTIRNPWGGSSSSYNAEFQASIDEFWNSSVKAIVAISDPVVSTPSFSYSISSDAPSSSGAKAEGEEITFTITRTGTESVASTVYLSTSSATAGSTDFVALSNYQLEFSAYESSKTITVSSYLDALTEGVESFELNLYGTKSATSSSASSTAYIKDTVQQAYSYSITSSTSSSSSAVEEGGEITFTISRSGSGESSTVYLSTSHDSTSDSDLTSLSNSLLTFAAYETEKTVTVTTLQDGSTEDTESFTLGLYKSISDSSAEVTATGYIKDLPLPVYSYTISSAAGSSSTAVAEGEEITFTITRSGSGSATTVYLSTEEASAGSADYVALDKQAVTFAANQTVATVEIQTLQDWWLEANEYFTLNLYTHEADTVRATHGNAFIKDNPYAGDNYTISHSATESSPVSEGGSITFTVTRDNANSASTIYVSTVDGSAEDDDFTALEMTPVSFAAYESSQTFTVQTLSDSESESDEYFWVNIYRNKIDSSYSEYTKAYIADVASSSYSYTVSSDASYSAPVTEGGDVTFTITRDGSGSASTVYLGTSNATTEDEDYQNLDKYELSFTAYETEKTVTLATYQDSESEGKERFWLDLYESYADAVSDNYAAYASATIDDSSTTVTDYSYSITSSAGYSSPVTEGESVTFTITRDGSGSTSTVYLSTSSSSAEDEDYQNFDKYALSFASYETSKTVTVATYQDSETEGKESFWLDLFESYTDALSYDYSAYATSYIDDAAVIDYGYTITSSTSSSSPVTEGESITFTITRDGSGSASTVYLSTSSSSAEDEDYQNFDKYALSFASYETSKTVTVATYQDSETEGKESFWLDLYETYADALDGDYSTYASGYITDSTQTDYSYTISSSATSSSPVNEGETVTFTITRNDSGSKSVVYLSTSHGDTSYGDYEIINYESITFEAYDTSKTFTLETYQDSKTEGDEYFWLDLYESYADWVADDYATYSAAYITDAATVDYSYSVTSLNPTSDQAVDEGEEAIFLITRDGSSTESTIYLSTSHGSTEDTDYSAVDTKAYTFDVGETQQYVSIDTYKDSESESAEYFWLILYKTKADALSGNHTIYDASYIQDVADVDYDYSITSNASSGSPLAEGSDVTFTITRQGSGSESSVYIKTLDGTATSSDYSALETQEISFSASQTIQTITVDTYSDSLTEENEYFWLILYEDYADTVTGNYEEYASAYIGDESVVNYDYTVTSDTSFSSPANEGETITFTITRDGSGSSSTVYISTTASTADSSDYAALSGSPLTFAADETSKTITVTTYSDSVTEGKERFWLDLFKTEADVANNNYDKYAAGYFTDLSLTSALSSSGLDESELERSDTEDRLNALSDNTLNSFSTTPPSLSASSSESSTIITDDGSFPGHGLGMFTNDYAFAAIKQDGSVVTWGHSSHGGDSSSVSSSLTNVQQITPNGYAYAALKQDGSVITWGHAEYGGSSSGVSSSLDGSVAVTALYSTPLAFAALRSDGSVITWGDGDTGGDSSALSSSLDGSVDVSSITSNMSAFAALRSDGSVVSWGYDSFGGDSSSVASSIDGTTGVSQIYATGSAFAALRSDGSVITWGNSFDGGDSSSVASSIDGTTDVSQIYATTSAFAALRSDGSVITWGDENNGGNSSDVTTELNGTTDVSTIVATNMAFAALHSDGSVTTWGNSSGGGDSGAVSSQLDGSTDITKIYANNLAFAAITSTGAVVTWGHGPYGGDSSDVSTLLDGSNDAVEIVATDHAFAALMTDGSVVAWGSALGGGDTTDVASSLDGTTDVTDITATSVAFAALRSDGSVITWGDTSQGGSSSSVSSQLTSEILGFGDGESHSGDNSESTTDFTASTATLGRITVDSSVTGTVEAAYDSDWFAVSLTAGTTYQIDLEGSDTSKGTLTNPTLDGIYDSTGSFVSQSYDGNSGTSYNAMKQFTPDTTGTYYLAAGSHVTGSYTLSITDEIPTPSDDYGDSVTTTGALSLEGSVTGSVEEANDSDWFAVSLTKGTSYQIDLKGADSSGGTLTNPTLYGIYDSSGSFISGSFDSNSGSGLDAQKVYTPDSSGSYYIAAGSHITGTYTLSITSNVTAVSDDYAGSSSTTGSVSVDGSVTGSVEEAHDIDWFAVNLSAGVSYQVDIEGVDSDKGTLVNPTLYGIYNSASSYQSASYDGNNGVGLNAREVFTPDSSGSYYLAAGSHVTGTYTLSVSTSVTVSSDDYGDTTSTTGLLTVGGSVTGTVEEAYDRDWFAVALVGGTSYQIDVEGADTSQGSLANPTLMGVYDAGGEFVSGTYDSNGGTDLNAQTTLTPVTSGTYYVAASSHLTGTYTLSMDYV